MKRWVLVTAVFWLTTCSAADRPIAASSSVKQYVMANYAELQNDLQKGGGSTLTSLLSMLRTPAEDRDRTFHRMRALSEAYPTPSEFAERVPDLTHQNQTPALSAVPESESDLEKLFGHMKYKTHLHLFLMNGDELEGLFNSFNPSQQVVWIKVVNLAGEFDRKVFPLQTIRRVSLPVRDSSQSD